MSSLLFIRSLRALPVRLPRDHAAAQGTAGSPHALAGQGTYLWSEHYPALYSRDFETCLVRLELSDGRVGWGEAQAPLAPEVAGQIVDLLLAPALVGEPFSPEPSRIAELWQRMYSTMRVRGQTGGFMLDAIAGVDLALWSFVPPKPIRDSIPAYVSGVPGRTLEERLQFVAEHWQRGHRLFKLYYGRDWSDLLATIDALLAAHAGIRIAVDALWHLPPEHAVSYASALADRGIAWLECPLLPEDVEGHVQLVEESGVRLALGESYRTRYEALPFLDRDIVSFWQPDLGRSGLTETLYLARLAAERGVSIVPHVSIALSPQLNAAVRAARMIPHCPCLEYNPSVVEMANRFADPPLVLDQGHYREGCGELSPTFQVPRP